MSRQSIKMKVLILVLFFAILQHVFSGNPCMVAQGTTVLTVGPNCSDKLVCSVQCNSNKWKMSCPSGNYLYGIEIEPKYGLGRHHAVACGSNTAAMKQLETKVRDTAFQLKGELSMSLIPIFGIPYSSQDRPKVRNYITKFFPLLENQEVLHFWRETKRVCDQTSGIPIPTIMNRFYTNVWKDPSITEGIRAYNETYPILAKYKLLGKVLIDYALEKYQRGVPLLNNWTPTLGKQTMLVEALAYLANLRAACPCEDVLNLITNGVAPDGKAFNDLKLPQQQIDTLVGFVGQACETKFATQQCKRTTSNTLEYDLYSDEEMLDLTW